MTAGSRTKAASNAAGGKRKYNSPLRQRQLAETRERIVAAGSELVHSLPSWDWKNLTARAVGERAGVSERTVHRHFSTERKLRDAVLQRLVEESGVDLTAMSLENFHTVIAKVFTYLSSFAATPESPPDPSQSSVDRIRVDVLLDAVATETPGWKDRERILLAAVLDMFWQPGTLDRFKLVWNLDADDAARSLGWLTGLIQDAISAGRRP